VRALSRRPLGVHAFATCARTLLLLTGVALSASCASRRAPAASDATLASSPVADDPPAMLLGTFRDDYGGRYTITRDRLTHGERSVYRIVEWHIAEQFLIAQNAETNPAQGGLWTRIDWLPFGDQGPFMWGYCFTVYDAPTRDAARAARPADRGSPRTGCNGFPFSRMQRVPDGGA
jgi:hypothetical protein